MSSVWAQTFALGVAGLALSLGVVPVTAGPAQAQEYVGPGTYVFPGAADASVVSVVDDVWQEYACFGVDRVGGDLHVTIGVVVACVEDTLDVDGPATRGTITVL